MAFLQNYKHDIFVSYAHVDNEPLEGLHKGWITIFVNTLKNFLGRTLGTKNVKVWMDYKLTGNKPLTPTILDALHNSATILIFVSPGYINSSWCNKERETFLRKIKERTDYTSSSNIFIVEISKFDKKALPSEFSDLIGYQFWEEDREGKAARILGMPVPRPDEREYYDKVLDIAQDMATELKEMAKKLRIIVGEEVGPEIKNNPLSDKTVFLAEVTDDLEFKREEIRRFLIQQGIKVLPEVSWYSYPDLEKLEEAIYEDIFKSDAFVQLLSGLPGRRPFNKGKTFTQIQIDCAQRIVTEGNKMIPILQWCGDINIINSVSEAVHIKLLQSPTVRSGGFESFKHYILEELVPPIPPLPPYQSFFVYLSADSLDREQTDRIRKELDRRGLPYVLPKDEGSPKEAREWVEVSILNCDVVLIVYCMSSEASVLNQIMQCWKIITQRDKPLKGWALYDGPRRPAKKQPFAPKNVRVPKLVFLDCRRDERVLGNFLDSLENGI